MEVLFGTGRKRCCVFLPFFLFFILFLTQKKYEKLREGIYYSSNGLVKEGIFGYSKRTKEVDLVEGTMICGKEMKVYRGQIRKGKFFQTIDYIRKKGRNLLKDGSITFKNGDIWEGAFNNWKWVKSEKEGDKHCTFKLYGNVTLARGGEKKEGVFLCEDNGMNFTIVKQLE